LILKEVPPMVVQESDDELPVCIAVGLAVSVQTGGGGSCVTVTVAVQVAVPPAPVAVPVYVIEEGGVTVLDPPETGVTLPTP
jgi:hypothetical protein